MVQPAMLPALLAVSVSAVMLPVIVAVVAHIAPLLLTRNSA